MVVAAVDIASRLVALRRRGFAGRDLTGRPGTIDRHNALWQLAFMSQMTGLSRNNAERLE
jgi:hypothetical protein